MRLTDEDVARLAQSSQQRLRSLAEEVLEARERGTMPTVDLASQLSTNRIPVNIRDGKYMAVDGAHLSVAAWTPELDGKGKTTQVHLKFDLGEIAPRFTVVHCMKSGPGVDQLIRFLAQYRGEVWPQYRGVRVSG